MKKRLLCLTTAVILACSMAGCGDVKDDSSAVDSTAAAAVNTESVETPPDLPEIEPVPVPEGGWTEETISEVIYVNGTNIKLPCEFEELNSKINILVDENHLYFFPNGQGASTEIEYNGTEVGSAIIDDFSDEDNLKLGKIYSIICNSDYNELGENNSAPININGIELGSSVNDVEKNLSFDKDENDFGDNSTYIQKIGHYSIKIACKNDVVWHMSIVYVKG